MTATIRRQALVINGPNLNLLGEREPGLYGQTSLTEINSTLATLGTQLDWHVEFFQSNHEGAIIDAIHSARATTDGLIINAGAYTHTSIALKDALATVTAPVVEVHITNVHQRESYRHTSYISPVADAIIVGAGPMGYELALRYLAGQEPTS